MQREPRSLELSMVTPVLLDALTTKDNGKGNGKCKDCTDNKSGNKSSRYPAACSGAEQRVLRVNLTESLWEVAALPAKMDGSRFVHVATTRCVAFLESKAVMLGLPR